jgi:hypothetical protein
LDRFEEYACVGQIIVTDILKKKKDMEKNLGGRYDMDGILRCTIQFRNKVVSIEFICYTLFTT